MLSLSLQHIIKWLTLYLLDIFNMTPCESHKTRIFTTFSHQ